MFQNPIYPTMQQLVVVELASVLAGPSVGMFFAELGARVIKVENKKTKGDVTRTWKLPQENPQDPLSAYYCSVNWNKEIFWADLADETDLQTVYELTAKADIVVSNFKGGDSQKLKVDYDRLCALNERLIYAEITAFGRDSSRIGYDMVLQAESGWLYMNGLPDEPPAKLPVAVIDILAAHQLKEAILLSLLERQHTQKGGYVSVSLLDTAIASLANQATNWLIAGHIPQRLGSKHPNIAPYGDLFMTKDMKWVVLAVGTQKQFEQLCKVLTIEEILEEGCFDTNADRVARRKDLYWILQENIRQWDCDVFLRFCHRAGVPVGMMRNMKEVFEQTEAQDMLLQYPTAAASDATVRRCVRTVAFRKIE